jgi:hypothetical protein
MTKLCIRCNLGVSQVKFDTPGSKRCRKCIGALYYMRNKEKFHERFKAKYYADLEKSREACKLYTRHWREKNPDKMKIANKKKYDKVKADPTKYKKQLESVRKKKAGGRYSHIEQAYRDRSREKLSDNYIKRTLLDCYGILKYDNIPQELMDLKRKQIMLKRQIS